jgi:hypothetical protein
MRLWVAVCVLVFSLPALAQSGQSSSGPQTAASAEEAVKKSENPFADKISLSLNNTISFNSEPLTATNGKFCTAPFSLFCMSRGLHRAKLASLVWATLPIKRL